MTFSLFGVFFVVVFLLLLFYFVLFFASAASAVFLSTNIKGDIRPLQYDDPT